MAVDEAIMTMVGRKEATAHLAHLQVGSAGPLSLGYFQRLEEVDLSACRSRGGGPGPPADEGGRSHPPR